MRLLPRPVLLVSLATASSLLGDQLLYAVLPSHYTELGLLPFQVGLILSANRIVRLVTNHLAERLCRRFAAGVLLTLSLVAGACVTAVYGLSSSFAILLLARVCWGLCWSFIRQIGLMTVVDAAVEGHMGRLMGFHSGISRLGSISGNLVGALGHDLVGFTAILLIFAVVSLLSVPLGPLSRRSLPSRQEAASADHRAVGQASSWPLLLCGLVVGCVGQGILASTLGFMLRGEVGAGAQIGGISIGVATLTGMKLASRWIADLSAPLMGALTDRVGVRAGAFCYFCLGGASLLCATVMPGAGALVGGILLFYVCATGVGVTLSAQAGLRGPQAVASYVTASDLGSAIGPNLGWAAFQFELPSEAILLLGSGLYVLGGVTAGIFLRGKG